MGCHSDMAHRVSSKTFVIDAFADRPNIVEATAGTLVCCMPTTATVLGHLKAPFSSFLATSRSNFRGFTKFTSTRHHEELGSTSNLHPSFSNFKPKDDSHGQHEMQKPWSGAGVPWDECRAQPTTTIAFPLEDSRTHQSKKMEVTRGSGRQ